jgi:hypothetical protein
MHRRGWVMIFKEFCKAVGEYVLFLLGFIAVAAISYQVAYFFNIDDYLRGKHDPN